MKYFLQFFFLALFIQASSAQNSVDSVNVNPIKEVTVVGGLSGSFAMPMAVVNKSVIEKNSFNTPADALQRETGISLTRDGIWATSVNVRGLSEQRLLFLVDGDRIQTSSDIAAALSTVDMAGMEKIEVIKGASSVLYGTGAMGGMVNFVSERPTYSSLFHTSGKVASGFSSVNNLWANSANLNFTTNQWYIGLTGSFRTAQNAQSPKGEIASSQFHDASWGLKAGIKYSANEELLVNYQHVGAWDVGIPGVSAFPKFAVARYKKVDRNQLSGEYIISDINDYLKKLSLKVYTQNISRDVENIVNPTLTYLPSSLNKTFGAKITSDWLLPKNQSLILGVEGWQRKVESIRLKKEYSVNDSISSILAITGEQPIANAQMLDLGTFAYYSWKIIPSKLIMNAGLRLDYIRTANDSAFSPVYRLIPESSSHMYAQETDNQGFVNDKSLVRKLLFLPSETGEFSYAAHIDFLYHFMHQQSLAFSLANSYRTASIDERFKYISLGAVTKMGNTDLKPERGTFANLNYTLSTRRIQIKADVFANYLVDLIAEIQTSTAPKVFTNTNINKALFLGAELEANWNMCKHFSLFANASYTNTQDLDANTALPQIPPMSGFASLNYHSGSKFEASFSTLWAASQHEVAPGETKTPGHIIYNVDVHTAPIQLNNTYLQLFAGADNLLDTAYYNHLTSVRSGGTKYYEPGRNIYLKAKLNF